MKTLHREPSRSKSPLQKNLPRQYQQDGQNYRLIGGGNTANVNRKSTTTMKYNDLTPDSSSSRESDINHRDHDTISYKAPLRLKENDYKRQRPIASGDDAFKSITRDHNKYRIGSAGDSKRSGSSRRDFTCNGGKHAAYAADRVYEDSSQMVSSPKACVTYRGGVVGSSLSIHSS